MSSELSALIEQFKEIIQNGDEITPEASRKMLLAISLDTHTEVKKINGRLKKVEKVTEDFLLYPSLTWLLRHKTKATVATIVIVFTVLTLFYVSGLRAPIMDWLGLPPLLP